MKDLLILFLVPFLGGIAALGLKVTKAQLKLILSFSGAYVLGLSFFHILPASYNGLAQWTGVWVIAGFMLQMMLEVLSRGLEHGHVHGPGSHHHSFPWSVFLGLSLHEFLEGMPFGHGHDHGSELGPLLVGVLVHKLPVAFVLTGMLISTQMARPKVFGLLTLFCLMSPLGGLFSAGVENFAPGGNHQQVFHVVMALVIGMFLHIATTIIYETDEGHRFNATKMAVIVAGFILSFLSM